MIIHFSLIPKKIEMILLLTAEYSLKTNTEEINMTTQTQEQINQNCVETNSSYAFKTTNPDCKETKLFDLVRSGGHTAIDLIAAERYDALEWYKARASYLEKRVAELEEKYEKKDEDEDSDDEEEEEEEEITEEKMTTAWNTQADKIGMNAEMRERGLAVALELIRDKIPKEKVEEMFGKGMENVVRLVKQNEALAKGIEALARANGTLSLENHRLKIDIEHLQEALEEEEEPICCVRCDRELDEAKGEVCPRDWEGDSDAPMCGGCWDDTQAEEDAEEEETDEE